jgi:hypothetical protein
LAESAACILITNGNFGARGNFYSYYDGQVMMGLSVYLDTGGPDKPAACAASIGARATIDKVVDRSLAAQTAGVPVYGGSAGYWGYSSAGSDSSTTQFTLAGLSASKNFYTTSGESADKNRIPLLTAALKLTGDGYAANGQVQSGGLFDSCGAGGCKGHSYQSYYGSYYGSTYNSPQQTASGTWGQLAGGRTVNDPSVQSYLRWLQNAYNPTTNPSTWYYGDYSYFYFLWSSSKAYNIIQQSGIAPAAGNIGPDNAGTLPALTAGAVSRVVNRTPSVDPQPAPRGGAGAGYYGSAPAAPAGWYYDYAYRLMSLQTAAGQFPNPLASWGYPPVDHAYAILVLQRSLGGACIDSDGDGVCDNVDNCPSVPNPDQADSNRNGIGDVCEPPPATCDMNGDGKIDRTDIAAITALRNKPASVNPKADADGNGMINVVDARICTGRCTNAGCAP